MRRRLALLVLSAVALTAVAPALAATPFRSYVRAIPSATRATMTGRSWHAGCPVSLDDLRLVTLSYVGFDGRTHAGTLVVNRSATGAIVTVFRRLYDERFPIRRMLPVDAYGGSDFDSIEADNTSSFNCRSATGSTHWSQHAYGLAIDLNPIENPYLDDGKSSHRASTPYLDRARVRPGMAVRGGALVAAFASVGWGWGGSWSGSVQDTQHFSVNGR
ncbi:MAG: M15 family metallopeptidase [Gaiellales bacterium]